MATTGFSVYENYCNGHLLDKSVYISELDCSTEHEKEQCTVKAVDCCKSQVEFLKLDVNLKHSEWQIVIFPYIPAVISFINWEVKSIFKLEVSSLYNHIIPLVPLYIFHQQLTFYN